MSSRSFCCDCLISRALSKPPFLNKFPLPWSIHFCTSLSNISSRELYNLICSSSLPTSESVDDLDNSNACFADIISAEASLFVSLDFLIVSAC